MENTNRANGQDRASRPVVLAIRFALAVLLMWLLWPVRFTSEGNGMVQPRFEDLVRVIPGESGMVCRVMAERSQEVRAGEPLFEYVPAGKFSVLAYSPMTPPGGGTNEPELPSDSYQKAERERVARIEAANRWSSRVLKQANTALRWESDLAQRLAMVIPREADHMLAQAQQNENTRLGRESANKVYTFSEERGETIATEQGIPLVSPVSGMLYSLWVQPRMQIFGAPAALLPTPPAGGPPMTALHAAGASSVAEIMPPGAPFEVLALIPALPGPLYGLDGWTSSLAGEAAGVAVPSTATKVEIGRVSLDPSDAGLLVPQLSVPRESVFVRLNLTGEDRELLGTKVRVKVISPLRPRAWFWLHGIWATDSR